MKRADQKSIEWQIAHHPMAIGGDDFADLVEYVNINPAYVAGYEQAEKDTIERAIVWLNEHANDYIVDLTPTYPDAPINIIVGGMCWEDLKNYLENE